MTENGIEERSAVQILTSGEKEIMTQSQPFLLSVHDLVRMGVARSMAYQLLNRADMPVVQIGTRKFMHRELFLDWLQSQARGASRFSGQ